MTSTATQGLPVPESPYPGIEPFRFMDQQIFAARDAEIWDLQSSITIYRAVLIYGDSGTGKSSLINAGLTPRILDEDYMPDRLRVQPRAGKEIKVERIRSSAGECESFLPSTFAKDETTASFDISIEAFMSRLLEFKPSAAERRAVSLSPILIFDQFEEFITLFEENMRGDHAAQAAEAAECQKKILDSLVQLINDEELPIKLLFVFREDYLAKLNILFEHVPKLLDQYLRLLPPHTKDLKQIIRAPFEKEELRREFVKSEADQGHSELTDELAAEIACELARRSEGGRVNLSELQIVCRKLWESTDPVSLFKDKGIQGLLEQYMSAAVEKFPEELRDPAVALLGHMITSSNTRNIISQDDLIIREKENFSRERIERALKALIESKLVLREPRRNVYFYEIVSEFLVPWIKQQQAARQALLERRKLEQEAAAQVELANKQKRKQLVVSLVVGLILVLVLIGAYLQIRNYQARKIATLLLGVTSNNANERLEALTSAEALLRDEKVPEQVVVAVLSIGASDPDPRVAEEASRLIKALSTSNDELADSLSEAAESDATLASKLPPRFYIHLANPNQKKRAEQIEAALVKQGYIVPPCEVVGENLAPPRDIMKYFHQEEERQSIIDLLINTDGHAWTAVYVKGYEDSARVRPGHFEIWLANEEAEDGTLVINFQDEDGNEIREIDFKVTLSPTEKTARRPIIRRTGYIEAPPGNYIMRIEAKGYKEVRQEITLNAGEELDLLRIKLYKETAEPRQP
ncbi:MAG TPA: hypothetical protein VKA70_13190 [Blastocatellia bacterium]|nr:hypothetical protein [Blastocatellia bacterium]